MVRQHRRRAVGGLAVVSLLALALAVIPAKPAGAVVRGTLPKVVRSNTQLTLSSTGNGQSVSGFLSNAPLDVTEGYPVADNDPAFTRQDESFAGVIIGTPTDGSPPVTLYCIDIRTDTFIGVGYQLGTWDEANVPNVGFVARLLNDYYPQTNAPDPPTDLNQKAAAVQAAIWFFSDNFVLSDLDSLYSTVKGIVTAVLAAGPLVEPPPPSLTISPSDLNGPAGSILGPYTVTSSEGDVTVTATGATMYGSPSATMAIPNGTVVPSGTQIWLKSDGTSSAVLEATAKAVVPSGNVYLYDGNSSLTDAQRLILSQSATLTSTVSATGEFQAPGSLLVTKTITGPAATHQGTVTIRVTCDGAVLTPDFVIDAGVPAGDYSHTYTNIPAGSICTVNEVAAVPPTMTVVPGGDGQQVTIPAGGQATAHLTDTYNFVPGSIVVQKSIEGPAAGHQGAVTITVTCDGTLQEPVFTIDADAPAGIQSKEYDGIAAGADCTVREDPTGQTSTVTATVTGNDQAVTVGPAQIAEVDITDSYDFVPGNLTVTKTITNPVPGSQGQITISVTCTDVEGATTSLPDFVIVPPGSPTQSMTYSDIPGNSVCTVVETQDGHTPTVGVARSGPSQVTIPPNDTATVDLTDTYETGDLVVDKLIDGDAAGHQGAITVLVSCTAPNGATTDLPNFDIAAGATGNQSNTYTGIAGGSTCTVTESPDGTTSTVTLDTNGTIPQTVTVAGDGTGTADVSDTYSFVTADLTVNKTVAGSAAGKQGAVTIMVTCLDPNGAEIALPDFSIPPETAAGTLPHTYTGIAVGSTCVATETENGSTAAVGVKVTGSPALVAIPVGGASTTITDTYTLAPGSLRVSKVIAGPFAGQQGAVTIHVVCGGTPLSPDFVIPARTPAGLVFHSFDGLPAGSVCAVTETTDGSTSTVMVTVTGDNQQVTVPAGGVVDVGLVDVYVDSPGVLTVTKQITGTAAGQQGEIGILVNCGEPVVQFSFVIPAGTPAGVQSRDFDGIPAGSTCIVTETSTGGTSTVAVAVTGTGQKVTVPSGGTATAHLTDTYTAMAPVAPITSVTVSVTG